MQQIYTGKFIQDSNQKRPSFLTTSGKLIENIDTSLKPDIDHEQYVEITLEDGVLKSWRYDSSVLRAAATNEYRMALVRVKETGDEFSESDREKHNDRVRRTQDEWNYILQNRGSMYVEPFYTTVEKDELGFYNFPYTNYRRTLPGGYGAWTHVQGVGGYSTGLCGLGRIGGWMAWTYNPNGCGWTTTAHELGHNLRLHHDGKGTKVYGGLHIMGNRGGRRSISAVHYNYIDLIAPDHIEELEVGEAKSVYLIDPDTHDMAVPMGCDKLAMCRNTENPKRVAVCAEKERVLIYIPMSENSIVFNQTNLVGELDKGEVFDDYGVHVEYLSYDKGIALTSIRNQTETQPETVPVPIYPEPDVASSFEDKSGIWGNPAWKLQGLQVRYLSGRNSVYVSWLTWDLNYHTRRYQGELSIKNGVARGSIRTGREDEIVGEASIYFSDSNTGVFRAWTEETGRFATPLHRLSVADPKGINGRFGLGNKEGLSIEQLDNGRIIGYLLDYTNEGTSILPREGNTWKYLEQDPEDNVIRIYEPMYGMRGIAARDAKLEVIGTAELRDENIDLHIDGQPTKTASLTGLA